MNKTDAKAITAETWERYIKTHDVDLRNEILMAYIDIVTFSARRLNAVYSGMMQTGDVINQGVLSLIDCIDRFDPSRGIQFDTYASIRVRGSIIDYIRKQDWVPRRVRKMSKEIGDAYCELQNKTGRQASDEEVASYLGMDVDELNKTLGEVNSAAVLYFEDILQENAENFEEPDKGTTPEQEYQKTELKEQLAAAIDRLDGKEKMIVSLYYFENLKLKEIAVVMNVTASRVSQLHSKALLKLQSMIGDYVRDQGNAAQLAACALIFSVTCRYKKQGVIPMKINPSIIESAYCSAYGVPAAKKNSISEGRTVAAIDTAEASVSRDAVGDIKSAAIKATEKGAAPDRLRQLRDAVATGDYSVSGSDISEAMLR